MPAGPSSRDRIRRALAGRPGSLPRGLVPRPVLTVAAWAAALLLIGVAAYLALRLLEAIGFVLVPCAAAILLTALLQPVNRWLRGLRLGRGLAAGVTLVACIVLVLAIGGVVGYVMADRFDQLIDQFSRSLRHLRGWLAQGHLPVGPGTLDKIERQVRSGLQHVGGGMMHTITTVAQATFEVIAQVLLGIFVLFFLLYDGERIWHWLTGKVPARARRRVREAGDAAWVTLSGYVHGTLIIATIHGIVIGFALFLLGVPVFLPLGLLVFVGSFIPVVGALVAGGLSVLITLGTQGLIAALILLAVLLMENELEAHVLQPFVVGRYVRLHPLAIVLVLAAGTWLGGIIGALLAVPVVGIAANAWRPLTGRTSVVVEESRRESRLVRAARAAYRGGGRLVSALLGRGRRSPPGGDETPG